MKNNIVYLVMNDDLVYATKNKRKAEQFVEEKTYQARQWALDQMGEDDPDEEDIAEADFWAGYEGEYYEIERIDLSKSTEDDLIELSNGYQLSVADIRGMIKRCERDKYDF